MSAVGLLAAVLVVGTSVGIPLLLFWSRMRHLRSLGPLAEATLGHLTSGLFDEMPIAVRDTGKPRLEGRIGGEPIAVSAWFPPAKNRRYVQNGLKTSPDAEMSVTVGLHGATPRLSLVASKRAAEIADEAFGRVPTLSEVARAFEITIDPQLGDDLLDDELRTDLIDFVRRARSVRAITVAPDGLTVTWHGAYAGSPAGWARRDITAETTKIVEEAEAARIRAAALLGRKLQQRILGSLERRARAGVRIDAYRGGQDGPRIAVERERAGEELTPAASEDKGVATR